MKTTLFLLLLLLTQGCTLKEERMQIPPSIKPAPTVVTTAVLINPKPQAKLVSTPSSTQVKVMKFLTTNNKTIAITGDDNILKILNPEYQGRDVVLYLFGRDCPHCKHEIGQIKTLSHKTNLKIIGIHAHKMIGDKALKSYAKQIGYNFDILSFKNDITLIRYLKKAGIWYGGTPTHLLIDSSGNVQDISITELLNR